MEQRVSLVTLGVADVGRARDFYAALGWAPGFQIEGDVAFFQCGGLIVGLWGRDDLARDSVVEDGGGWGGVTLAHNVADAAAVDAVLAEASAAGAVVTRKGGDTFYGGYSGVFTDPDGHPWEVAWNPGWTLLDDGSVRL